MSAGCSSRSNGALGPEGDEREFFLRRRCGKTAALIAEIREILEAEPPSARFLDGLRLFAPMIDDWRVH